MRKIGKKGLSIAQTLGVVIIVTAVITIVAATVFKVDILSLIRNYIPDLWGGGGETEVALPGVCFEGLAQQPQGYDIKVGKLAEMYQVGSKIRCAFFSYVETDKEGVYKYSNLNFWRTGQEGAWWSIETAYGANIGDADGTGRKITISEASLKDNSLNNYVNPLYLLLKLNNAVVVQGYVYAAQSIIDDNQQKYGKEAMNVREVVVAGDTYYVGGDEYKEKLGVENIPLSKDPALLQPAGVYLNKNSEPAKLENGKEVVIGEIIIPVKPFPEDISFIQRAYKGNEKVSKMIADFRAGTIKETERIGLPSQIENPDIKRPSDYPGGRVYIYSKLGVDTGSDPLVYVYYKRIVAKIYVRFEDEDPWYYLPWSRNDKTPWIEMKYWNEHRTFANAPEGTVLED